MTKTVNSFRSHGKFANSEMDDKKADKKSTMNARTAGRLQHTRFVFIFGETCCNVVCVCLRMSTNVFIWIKHGTHRWFEQIRFPNVQNYPPIFRPRVKLGTHHAIFVGTTIVVRRYDGRRSSNDPHTPRDDRRMTRTHHATAVCCTNDGR